MPAERPSPGTALKRGNGSCSVTDGGHVHVRENLGRRGVGRPGHPHLDGIGLGRREGRGRRWTPGWRRLPGPRLPLRLPRRRLPPRFPRRPLRLPPTLPPPPLPPPLPPRF